MSPGTAVTSSALLGTWTQTPRLGFGLFSLALAELEGPSTRLRWLLVLKKCQTQLESLT